jgi:hypothetical protein
VPKFVSDKSSWFGLGRTRDADSDSVAHEAGCTDADCAAMLDRLALVTTPGRADAVRAMATMLGSRLPNSVRVYAIRGRRDAARAGLALPPWWRLRLAARRTAAYQTAQYGPGSTPADPT